MDTDVHLDARARDRRILAESSGAARNTWHVYALAHAHAQKRARLLKARKEAEAKAAAAAKAAQKKTHL